MSEANNQARLVEQLKAMINRTQYVCQHKYGDGTKCGTRLIAIGDLAAESNRAGRLLEELEAGDSVPAVSQTSEPSTLASETGSVEWEPAAHKPPSYQSVLVYGVLECEQSADTHEGYWTGQRWQSVRRDDDISALRKLKLLNVTHWACRPIPPNP